MTTTVQPKPDTTPGVRIGNAYVRTVRAIDGTETVYLCDVSQGISLNDVAPSTARDLHTALGQLLGVTR